MANLVSSNLEAIDVSDDLVALIRQMREEHVTEEGKEAEFFRVVLTLFGALSAEAAEFLDGDPQDEVEASVLLDEVLDLVKLGAIVKRMILKNIEVLANGKKTEPRAERSSGP